MNARMKSSEGSDGVHDRLESYGIYLLARRLFDEFWEDSELLARDFRGQELARQQVRSLDSVCANIEEGYGRGYGKELPQHLRISRGEARESKGRYQRCSRLLPAPVIQARKAALDRIIGGLTKTIVTIENRRMVQDARSVSRHTPPVTRHTP
jgi:four helix bundle protein